VERIFLEEEGKGRGTSDVSVAKGRETMNDHTWMFAAATDIVRKIRDGALDAVVAPDAAVATVAAVIAEHLRLSREDGA
jgi:hypothetical protein